MKQFTGVFKVTIINEGREGFVFECNNRDDFQKYLEHHEGVSGTLTFKPSSKSSEKEHMYAYYHNTVLDCAIMALTMDGWVGVDKVIADEYLKQSVAQSLVYNKKGDEVLKFSEDKKSMSKERLHKYLHDCILLLEERHGMQVPSAEEYKDMMRFGTSFKSTK